MVDWVSPLRTSLGKRIEINIVGRRIHCNGDGPHGSVRNQAQEKPDLVEQPERAPAGIELEAVLDKR